MISLVASPTSQPVASVKGTAVGKASGDDFVLSLAAFLNAIQPTVTAADSGTGDTTGQVDAAPGKELPDIAVIDDDAVQSAPIALPVFAWQAPIDQVVAPTTAIPVTNPSVGAGTPVVPSPLSAPLSIGSATSAAIPTAPLTTPPAAANDVATTSPPAASPMALATALLQADQGDAPMPSSVSPGTTPLVIDRTTPDKAAPQPAATPLVPVLTTPQAPVAGTTAPALQVFAAAIHAARSDATTLDQTLADTKRDTSETVATAVTTTATTTTIATPATAAAQDGALDMRHERWPHAMVDHIEALRDAADAVSTRIRLVPDALGGIDVSVQRDGDTVHVQFQADQAQTRALLSDAQPRLAEIAEQRGIRLGDTSVSGGVSGGLSGGGSAMTNGGMAGGNDQRPPNAPAPAIPTAPASAVTATVADADTRLA